MRNILVTGATGVIGSSLIPLLADEAETNIHLLVRAESDDHLQQRIGRLFDFWGWDATDLSLGGRLRAIRGDVCEPKLGLDDSDHERLIREVTHVIHSAGTVKLNRTIDEARNSAVGSVKNIVAFCRHCQTSGQFTKLDYVSTVGVAGRMPGLVPEEPLTQPREFHNTYEQSKAEAETYLLGEMQADLPATIHRPSMVVGDSRTGKVIHFQVFYHLCEFLSGKRTLGIIPDTGDAALDIVPSDYVARAIQIASASDDAVGRVFHLCSGPEGMVSISSLAELAQDVSRQSGESPWRLKRIGQDLFRRTVAIISCVTLPTIRRKLRTLPYFLDYLKETQRFDNFVSKQYFYDAGLELLGVDAYVSNVLAHRIAAGKRTA